MTNFIEQLIRFNKSASLNFKVHLQVNMQLHFEIKA